MKIAITGGTGFVGQALLDRAVEKHIEVSALARKAPVERGGVQWVQGDLSSRNALVNMMQDAEAVIHVAGIVNAPDSAGFELGNVTGTLNMLEAAKAAGVRRFVFVSSLSARAPHLSAYGMSKARAERLVRASGLDWTIVRPPAVYGPRDREMLDLFRAASWGFVPVPAQGRLSLIHVRDLADLLIALVSGGDGAIGAVLEPDDGVEGGWSHADFARAIGCAVGKRPRVIGLSPVSLQRAARVDGFLRGKYAKMTPDRAAYFSHPDWVVSKGARPPHRLWRPRVETREGLRATAHWYRDNGWL